MNLLAKTNSFAKWLFTLSAFLPKFGIRIFNVCQSDESEMVSSYGFTSIFCTFPDYQWDYNSLWVGELLDHS